MLWIAFCVATATVLFFSVEHFVPSTVERILRGLKPLLLLLQTPRGGNKPSAEVLLFQVPFRDDVCIVVRTILLSRDRLMSFTLGVAVIGPRARLTLDGAGEDPADEVTLQGEEDDERQRRGDEGRRGQALPVLTK